MVLLEARSPVAELLDRTIDAALSGRGDRRGFKAWAACPLPAVWTPPRPTLIFKSSGATCARIGKLSVPASAQSNQLPPPAEPVPLAGQSRPNLSLSSVLGSVAMLLAQAACWYSDGKLGGSCAAAPTTQASQPPAPTKASQPPAVPRALLRRLRRSWVASMLWCAVSVAFRAQLSLAIRRALRQPCHGPLPAELVPQLRSTSTTIAAQPNAFWQTLYAAAKVALTSSRILQR